MLKKIVSSVIIFALSSTIVFAEGIPYIGAGLGIGSQGGINAFGGYGAKLGLDQKYYLGGELFLNNLSYSQINHMNYGLGASLIPGVYLNNDTMVYTRLGIEAFRKGHTHHTKAGAQVGLGLQNSIAKNWDIRGEYVYTSNIDTKQFNVGLIYKFN